ncbi:MAG: hypothetical protein V3W41_02595 [Planctomycetota bacterium]
MGRAVAISLFVLALVGGVFLYLSESESDNQVDAIEQKLDARPNQAARAAGAAAKVFTSGSEAAGDNSDSTLTGAPGTKIFKGLVLALSNRQPAIGGKATFEYETNGSGVPDRTALASIDSQGSFTLFLDKKATLHNYTIRPKFIVNGHAGASQITGDYGPDFVFETQDGFNNSGPAVFFASLSPALSSRVFSKVDGRGIAGVSLKLDFSGYKVGMTTDELGRFSGIGLRDPEEEIDFNSMVLAVEKSGWISRQITVAYDPLRPAKWNLKIGLSPSCRLSGRLRLANGEPVSGTLRFSVFEEKGRTGSVAPLSFTTKIDTDRDGRCLFKTVPHTDTGVITIIPRLGLAQRIQQIRTRPEQPPLDIVIQPGVPVEVNVRLPGDDQPLRHDWSLLVNDETLGFRAVQDPWKEDSLFFVGIPGSRLQLVVSCFNHRALGKSFHAKKTVFLGTAKSIHTIDLLPDPLAAAAWRWNFNGSFSPWAVRCKIRFRNERGEIFVPSALISFSVDDEDGVADLLEPEGAYACDLPPGRRTLHFRFPDYDWCGAEVKGKPGETIEFILDLNRQ